MPLRSALGLESQAELLVSAMTFFENQAKISESTLRLQPLFKSIVENGPKELTFVEDFVPITENENSSTTRILATRLSLGALRYTPSFIDLTTENLSEEVLLDLDKLNNRLAEKLAEVYDASLFYRAQELFSDEVVANGAEDQARSPRSCIGIGLDRSVFTRERVKNLVDNISRYGREMETSHEFVENISAVVRRGIEQAEMELKSEMSDDVHVFRTLPVIGTVLSIIGVPRPSKSPQRMRPHGPVARTFTISSGFSTVPLAGAPQPGRMSISLTHDNLSESPRLPERRASDGQVLSTGIQFLPEVEPSGIQEPAIV
ncbi:hypothetical protein BC829DRAFT_302380 [Chytridium lagenaria]|nr:hypothetical protein BC829DRAFT_302380 [Chytridium lagenaria]